jgi:hypothetical protein
MSDRTRHTRRCELGNSGAAAMRVGRRSIDHKVDSTWPLRSKVASALSSKFWDIGSIYQIDVGSIPDMERQKPFCLIA